MNSLDFVAINVGNTRTQVARFIGGAIENVERHANADLPRIVQSVIESHRGMDSSESPIVIASVNHSVAMKIQSNVVDQLGASIYRIGDDLLPPIGTQLDPETMTGVDRLLNAAAAYAAVGQACIIIDAGTAITVDFVDGAGTFQGGAIAPGARLQLQALHEHTAALPALEYRRPEPSEVFGKNTADAMLRGVHFGLRGLVWKLVEQYAEAYGAFPQVIATGGDAETLFGDDDLVNNIVPDLTLLGISAAVKHALAADADDAIDP